jgi:uncharacterized protein
VKPPQGVIRRMAFAPATSIGKGTGFRGISNSMRGTLLNTATVVVGGSAGWLAGNLVSPSVKEAAITGLGLVTVLLGVRMFSQTRNAVIIVAALAIGGMIGAGLQLNDAIGAGAEFLRTQLGGGSKFNEGLIGSFILFCVGPMTLLGCLQDGLEGKIELLATKAALDGISAFFFAASTGPAVLVTAALLFGFQAALTLLAKRIQGLSKNEAALNEIAATGGAMVLGTGLGLLAIKDVGVANFLPALLLAPIFSGLATRLEGRKA